MKPSECYIWTRSGQKFFPLLPEPEKILIEDIAHALSNICRYTGHVEKFYSVAQHSVLVSMDCPKKLALAGLLHDASEAYICDVSSPVKKLDSMKSYREVERTLQATIYSKFGVPFTEPPPKVMESDVRVFRLEAPHLLPYFKVDGLPVAEVPDFSPWPPEKAKLAFLERYASIVGSQVKGAKKP